MVHALVASPDDGGVSHLRRLEQRSHLSSLVIGKKGADIDYSFVQFDNETMLTKPPKGALARAKFAGIDLLYKRVAGQYGDPHWDGKSDRSSESF
jgi:hypothetical protein